MSSEVWIGDLLRATAAQGAGSFDAVAGLLGFERITRALPPSEPGPARSRHVTPAPADPRSRPNDSGRTPVEPPRPAPAAEPRAEAPAPTSTAPRLLTPVYREPRRPVVWSAEPLPRHPSAGARKLPHQPLLAPRSAAAVTQAAAARRAPGREVDIPAVVAALSLGRPLLRLPARPEPTLRFGVQLLVDWGVGMQPFHRDAQELVRQVRATVGRGLTEVLHFEDCPSRGAGPADGRVWPSYAPPAPGTPVLLVTDLSIGRHAPATRRAGRREWEQWVSTVRRTNRLVAFVPYPRRRWPQWATSLVQLVPWDRGTTVGWVRAHVG
ncbi:hypothetical protein PGH47_33830 [Streptomyces sp. HUAS 31]|uniref:hypothetical protein n=1 Tax=Streptomyces TaxID=1883 RepID=UPI002304D947|nr:hypothetical protein [Streptomyces sp. HUAS 31]WCE00385.1 hypothetical protein PGH47_33830 [Streptomyces sp. HUAS 31]